MTPLAPEEEQHSRAVAEVIRGHIHASGGWIPFDRFMELALYAPGLGYYSAGSMKLGAGGDFVTAPELSDLFSICVARQCGQILIETGGSILELGAGTGRMAAVVMDTLASLDALPEQYAILEVSADLRERQEVRLSQLAPALRERVVWLDRLPEQPVRGVVLANEVLDALPCERFVLRDAQAYVLGVGVTADGTFVEREVAADDRTAAAVKNITSTLPGHLPDGYRSELCTRVTPWITGVGECLEQGAVLLFDYGLPRAHYYHTQRSTGTLRCHFKQQAHADPLVNVGVQDITAWVDFTRVAEAADAAGLEVRGFATQMAYLVGTGIETLLAQAPDAVTRARLGSEARQLLMPGEMGEIFKAMALVKGSLPALSGFSVQDLRHLL
jgi:SAM-dependent MidA family methyltransferase